MTVCLVVQHVAPEPAWAIGDSLGRAGVQIDLRRVFEGDPLPADLSTHQGVVVMGGPMSATTDSGFPTRRAELRLLTEALGRAVPTVGVCLGAQLLAEAAGAPVYPGADGLEVGWSPVEFLGSSRDDPLLADLPVRLDVLHWHGDTYELPEGARHLARSSRYAQQAFRVGICAWGFQFHLEVTTDAVEGLLEAFPSDAAHAAGGEEGVRRGTPSALAALSVWRDLVFDRFAVLVAGGVGLRTGEDGLRRRFAEVSES